MLQNLRLNRALLTYCDKFSLSVMFVSLIFILQVYRVLPLLSIPVDFNFLLSNPLFVFTSERDMKYFVLNYYNPAYSIIPFLIYKSLHGLGILNGYAIVIIQSAILVLSCTVFYLLIRHFLKDKHNVYAMLLASWLFINPFSILLVFKSNSLSILLAFLCFQILALVALKTVRAKNQGHQVRWALIGLAVLLLSLLVHNICSTFLVIGLLLGKFFYQGNSARLGKGVLALIGVGGIASVFTFYEYYVLRSGQIYFFDLYPLFDRLLLYAYTLCYYFFNVLFSFNQDGWAHYPFYQSEEIPSKLFIYPITLLVVTAFFIQYKFWKETLLFFSLCTLLFIWGLDLLPIQNDYVVQLDYYPFYVTLLILVASFGFGNQKDNAKEST